MYQGIITAPKATLYESPTKEAVSDELLSGWIITIKEECGEMLKITTHYGYSGWLKRCVIRRLSDSLPHFSCVSQTALLRRQITDILQAPTVQAPVLATLFLGSHVTLCNSSSHNGWQRIKTAAGTCGYVPAISLLPVPFPAPGNHDEWDIRSCILTYALSFLGTPYRWGGKTAMGIDCSGLTFMCYYMCGITIYRDAIIKEGFPVRKIPFSQIKPADLLYFPGHVAIYLGMGKYIHCTGNLNRFGCVINSLRPEDEDYRADLANSLLAAGSVFA